MPAGVLVLIGGCATSLRNQRVSLGDFTFQLFDQLLDSTLELFDPLPEPQLERPDAIGCHHALARDALPLLLVGLAE
jgi:hypothetical protein